MMQTLLITVLAFLGFLAVGKLLYERNNNRYDT